jgi:transcriptional regulator of aromatic amino acid metabolism
MVAKFNIGIFLFFVTEIQNVNIKSIITLGKTATIVTKFNSNNNRKFVTLVRKVTMITLVNKINTNFLMPSSREHLNLSD